MKFTISTNINKPVQEVIHQFDNPENLKHWMEGLISFRHLEGTAGEPGAKSELIFQMGKQQVRMIETVTVKNLPQEFSGTYDAGGVTSFVKNRFESIDDQTTRYTTENEFHFKGFMKLIALFMPGAFKKQSIRYAEAFKKFCESA